MKSPRDFVHIDELWKADLEWPDYFLADKLWIFADEYRPGLIGDEDYCRIIVQAGGDWGWLFTRPLDDKRTVERTLRQISQPVSQTQLQKLGFVPWHNEYI
jgi:hypothetical protein